MSEFKGKVAVITGASSGIGFGMAKRCADKGMHVVLVGLNSDSLTEAEIQLKNTTGEILSIKTDVANRDEMEQMAAQVEKHFGRVDLLFNNAGVGAGTTIWESTWNDWEWVISVNLMGVIHGIKLFTPLMLKQHGESYIVNNASIAGLLSFYPNAPYQMSKHGVVALTEHLHHSLRQQNANVHASVLCTGWISDTKMLFSERNRPAHLKNEAETAEIINARRNRLEKLLQDANKLSPEQVAEAIFAGIQRKELYIVTHPEYKSAIRQRMDDIVASSAS
ncbi:MAG TPA: SDR family NAD(P)-dependent oxidoreductase [Spongiibacteraceae bacterium]|jgi:NAD(P)-dependent dehydrogenase (short-subunit alcohol dehydrogenase family)